MIKRIELNKNILGIFILIVILLIGFFFRFYGINKRGFLDTDSAFHFREANTVASLAKWMLMKFCSTQNVSLKEYLAIYGDAIPSLPKEGFLSLASISIFIFGSKDYATLGVSALLGTLTIIVIYLIGRRLYGRNVGVLASLILAVSTYHIMYSREGMAHTTATFFLFLGFFLYILSILKENRAINKWIAFSGFFVGYSFTCHYTFFWVYGLFFIFELFNRSIPWSNKFKRLILFFVFALIPVFLFQCITFFVKELILKKPDFWTSSPYILENKQEIIMTYFQQLKLLFKTNLSFTKNYDPGVIFYPFCIWHYEGPIITFLLGLGLLIIIVKIFKKFSYSDFMVVSFFLFPLLGYTFSNYKAARTMVVISPLIALIVAKTLILLKKFFDYLFRPKLAISLTSILIIFILFFSLFNSIKLLNLRSGYKQAMEFIGKSGKMNYLYLTVDANLSLTEAYVDRQTFREHKGFQFESMQQARRLYETYGLRYVIVDQFKHYYPIDVLRQIESSMPVFETFHSTDAFFYDGIHVYKERFDKIKNEPKKLKIYDLKDILR